jgi:hypothetical protein
MEFWSVTTLRQNELLKPTSGLREEENSIKFLFHVWVDFILPSS